MNEFLRDRILRKLETLSDERLYQVLDYVEFLESRYAQRPSASPNVFQRFAEGVEDSLRAGRVSTATIAETMNLMNKAMGVLQGVAAAGRSVANEVVSAGTRPPSRPEQEAGDATSERRDVDGAAGGAGSAGAGDGTASGGGTTP